MNLIFRLPVVLLETLLRGGAKAAAELLRAVAGLGRHGERAEPEEGPAMAPWAGREEEPDEEEPFAPPGETAEVEVDFDEEAPLTAEEAIERGREREAAAAVVAEAVAVDDEGIVAEAASAPSVAAAEEEPAEAEAPAAAGGHIDAEAELVDSRGEADDVGAEVEVDEPWPGYSRQTAREIVARLRGADEATRAVVRLYEERHRRRATVLRATG